MVYSVNVVKPQLSPKRQRTRAVLVEATAAIIAERGLAAVSLDEVAARAGVTKGAIYSNYRSKGELMWAAVDRRRLHLQPQIIPGDSQGTVRAVAKAFFAQLPQAEREAAFYLELQGYIRTDPELRADQAAQQTAQFDEMAGLIEAAFGDDLALPPRALSLAVQALLLGFLSQWERTPDEVTEEVVTQAFEALAIGADRRRRRD
ncbi:TetR/AcrR family transcriptional regulator [Phenylobacterium sp.]|uniref:TetR/AcrR family transcriptional regulator n=1 Tax=Phenylobacterium sp. TaxID=1871053 RepID=UPI0025CE1661|nr:TetR/AcrR family transcriptional regulator [Phenylobacterium sp.]